ncbi:MAG TPA: UMP kinase [Candidatus Syntrophosphaera sp.]|jgi:uridylate kinase|nr:UMP kinase [Candidatus Syntrophosphaera sp.]HQM79949.1 UMP kinase [Candidatus Syntrophosphaera sp.]
MLFQPEKIHRVMLKISGEILAGPQGYGFDDEVIDNLTDEIIKVRQKGYSIAIVLGGGNIFRGGTWKNQSLDRVVLDHIGMLATIQNSLYLAEILNLKNCPAIAFSCLAMDNITELYTPPKASEALERGEICFISGGTGNPFFTTDTAAILRAAELGLDLVLKGTKVDGLYTADPKVYPDAQFIRSASYTQCLEQKLGVMDMTAFSLAQENRIPLKIFNLTRAGGIEMALSNPDYGTYIYS